MRRPSPLTITAFFGVFILVGSALIALIALTTPLYGQFFKVVSSVVNYPATIGGIISSVRIALMAQVGSVVISIFLLRAMTVYRFAIPRSLAFYLAMPHVAFAIGFAFLFSPSGWFVRVISPWLTGFSRPPDWLIINDSYGISMALVLTLKETPYLVFMGLVAMRQLPSEIYYQQGASLGHNRAASFKYIILPQLLRLMLLPMLAVLVYSLSVVDVALIVGPQRPVVFSILTYQWFFDPDRQFFSMALVAAILLLLITVVLLFFWVALIKGFNLWLKRLSRKRNAQELASNHAARIVFKAFFIVYLAAVSALILFSIAKGWRFPDALPTTLSVDGWFNMRATRAITDTLITAICSSIIASGFAVVILEFQIQRDLTIPNWVMAGLLLLPQITVVLGLYAFALTIGWRVGWTLTIVGHAIFIFPYAYIAMNDSYRRFDQSLYQSALMLGHSPFSSWWRIKWPLVNGLVVAAFTVAMSSSIVQYLPTQVLGAGRVDSVTIHAVNAAAGFDRGIAARWALIQLVLGAIGFSLAIALLQRKDRGLANH